MIVVSFGGGVNSTAMLVGMVERGEKCDLILFADTGDEKPHTYEHILEFSKWLVANGMPEIITIKGDQPQMVKDGSLSAECWRLGNLPAKAYGGSGCSMKWKIEPQEKFMRKYLAKHQLTGPYMKLVGYDADEPERADRASKIVNNAFTKRFPLVEWGWGRDDCVDAIGRAGLKQPGKSACWHCPSTKKWEILELKRTYPRLLDRALEMERRAIAGEGPAGKFQAEGLGRNFSWAGFLKLDESQQKLFPDVGMPEIDCGCYDGESA